VNSDEKSLQVAYIGLGSNLDDPVSQIERAFEHLEGLPGTRVIARSSLYRSAPVGHIEQPDFVNAVISVETTLSAAALLEHLQQIERSQGRTRGEAQWGPRILDLDLLLFGDAEIDDPDLTVPHPGIGARNFVLLPLREIAPGLVIPNLGRLSEQVIDEDELQISLIT